MRKMFGIALSLALPIAAARALTLPGRGFAGAPIQQPLRIVRNEQGATHPIRSPLRLASYNIQQFTDGIEDEPPRTLDAAIRQARAAAALLMKINADIVVLQEIENVEALRLLNEQFPEPYPIAAVTQWDRKGSVGPALNLAVLSRVPIQMLRELDFSPLRGGGRPPRGLLSFAVDLDERHSLLVYVVHLKSNFTGSPGLNRAKRRNAMKILHGDAVWIRTIRPDRIWEIMVVGDMNTDPDLREFARDPTLRPLEDWIDLWRGRPLPERVTVPTRYGDPALEFPPAAFDRVVVSPELIRSPWIVSRPAVLQEGVNTRDVTALPGLDPEHVSDHYPIFVEIAR